MVALRKVIILLLAASIAFGASLFASFHFDDYSLFSDRAVTSSSGWYQVWDLTRTRPLTYLTFWINYQIDTQNPVGYHAFNLVLHLLAAWLAFDSLKRLVSENVAFVAALIFAIHPIQTEAVSYIFARSTLLMTVFCLLSFRDWLRGFHWRATLWFAVALLAKEECVAFPLFLFLLHLSISRNVRELKAIAVMVGLALLAGARVLFAVAATPGAGAGSRAGISAIQYLGTQGGVILRYLRFLIVPYGFSVDPDIPLEPKWWAWLIVIAAAAIAARWFSRARAGFWFVAGLVLLLPSSSILAAADLAVDRRMYLPLLAFATCAALLLAPTNRYGLAAIMTVLLVLSIVRTQVWRGEESLWTEAVERAPKKIRPRIQLARALPPDRAIAVLEAARNLAPNDPSVATELGRIYLDSGAPAKALAEFGRALALLPNNPRALSNRGVALMMLQQPEAARQDFVRALSLDPCQPEARLNATRMGITPPLCTADPHSTAPN